MPQWLSGEALLPKLALKMAQASGLAFAHLHTHARPAPSHKT